MEGFYLMAGWECPLGSKENIAHYAGRAEACASRTPVADREKKISNVHLIALIKLSEGVDAGIRFQAESLAFR